jgi:hypothetical protein
MGSHLTPICQIFVFLVPPTPPWDPTPHPDDTWQIFVFLVMLNIFLAILNDAYIAIKFKFDAEELEEPPPPLTIKQRWEKFRAWLRQRHLDQRIEALRKQQRQRELVEKRAERKVNEARTRTLKAMGVDPEQQARGQGGGGGGNDSALLRTEEL